VKRDELDQLMLLYAAGAADDAEAAQAEQILARGDPAGQAAHTEAQAILASMALGLDRVESPVSVRERLFARVSADVENDRATAPIPISRGAAISGDPHASWRTWLPSSVAAALLIGLIVSLFTLQKVKGEKDRLASNWGALQQQVQDMQDVMSSPHVTLAKFGDEHASYGRVLYCPVMNEYHVSVFQLAPPKPGRVYELWLITPDKGPVPSGLLELDEHGNAQLTKKMPRGTPVAVAALTEEPAGGSDHPTTQPFLASEPLSPKK
jgi:anti-sigma-K factor RskA